MAPPMTTPGPGSRAMAIGFTVMLLSVGAGIYFNEGGFGLLLSFTGLLAGTNLVAASVRMADVPAPTFPAAAFVRRNTAAVGLVMASCALTMVSGSETEPVLCFVMFALLLLGLSLIMISIGARGE